MQTPTPTQLLDLYDLMLNASPIERALLCLQAAWPDEVSIPAWSFGTINARLLRLRAALFGRHWVCLADCPQCGTVVEIELDLDAMVAPINEAETITQHRVEGKADADAPWTITFRLPAAEDLLQLEGRVSSPLGGKLLERVVLGACLGDKAIPACDLSAGMRAALERRAAELDPFATVDIVVDCAGCSQRWSEPMNVIHMLCSEINAIARQLIREVSHLAAAFGWSEAAILAMTPARRQRYLEVIG